MSKPKIRMMSAVDENGNEKITLTTDTAFELTLEDSNGVKTYCLDPGDRFDYTRVIHLDLPETVKVTWEYGTTGSSVAKAK